MLAGVSFKLSTSDKALWQIFKSIDVTKYNWYNIDNQNEVWLNYQGGVWLNKEYYRGEEFLNKIVDDHFIIFLKLQAYLENDNFFDIQTYEEFQKSDCQLLLLIYDCVYVEVYAKDQSILKSVYENASRNDYSDLEYITKTNMKRSNMNII